MPSFELILVCSLLTALPSSQTPSESTGSQHAPHATKLHVDIDGAATPNQIPDELAYRHLIIVLATPAHPSAGQVARRDALIKQIGLSRVDVGALISAVAGVQERALATFW
jgi:hypothetical protein